MRVVLAATRFAAVLFASGRLCAKKERVPRSKYVRPSEAVPRHEAHLPRLSSSGCGPCGDTLPDLLSAFRLPHLRAGRPRACDGRVKRWYEDYRAMCLRFVGRQARRRGRRRPPPKPAISARISTRRHRSAACWLHETGHAMFEWIDSYDIWGGRGRKGGKTPPTKVAAYLILQMNPEGTRAG